MNEEQRKFYEEVIKPILEAQIYAHMDVIDDDLEAAAERYNSYNNIKT